MRKDTGVDGDAQRISQMVWMLFMKIFADKEEEWAITIDNYESPIPENLKWQKWAADDEGRTGDELMEFIDTELFPALKELDITVSPQAQIIRSVFDDTYNYMKNGTLFRQVINVINTIISGHLKPVDFQLFRIQFFDIFVIVIRKYLSYRRFVE